jgi:hypothetical protein
MCQQVSSTEIDQFEVVVSSTVIPSMTGISNAHHVYSRNDMIYQRELSCHCGGEGIVDCLCFQPQSWKIDLPLWKNETDRPIAKYNRIEAFCC